MSSELTTKIKELREKTNAGFVDCKKALEANGMDLERASEYLREKGIASFSKRSSNKTNSGDFGIYEDGNRFCIVTLLTETDFVANTREFMQLADDIARALIGMSGSDLGKGFLELIPESMHSQVLSLKENIQLGPVMWFQKGSGPIYYYLHRGGSNRFAGVIQVDSPVEGGRDIAVHIACAVPEPIALRSQEVNSKAVVEFIQNAAIDGDQHSEEQARGLLSLLGAPFLKDTSILVQDVLGKANVIQWCKLQV